MLQIRYAMDNQVFYDPNFNNQAPPFRNPQFRSFNPKPKPASEVEKKVSPGARPTQNPGGSETCEELPARIAASPAEDTRLQDSVHVETPEFPSTEGHHAEDDCSHNHSAVGNAADTDSDSQDDLRSLFSGLGDDSSDAESHPDCKRARIQKPPSDGMVGETWRLGTGDSKDTRITLDNESVVDTPPESEREERCGFSGRIPLSPAAPERCHSGSARSSDEINSDIARYSPRKRKRDSDSEASSPDAEEPRLLAVSSGHDEHGDQNQPPSPVRTSCRAGRHVNESRSDLVWEYRRLRKYKIVNGKPLVQVIWCPTWEPAGEFSTAEVERISRQYEWRKSEQQGQPPLKRVRNTQGRRARGSRE